MQFTSQDDPSLRPTPSLQYMRSRTRLVGMGGKLVLDYKVQLQPGTLEEVVLLFLQGVTGSPLSPCNY
jgi:hypothetical protein